MDIENLHIPHAHDVSEWVTISGGGVTSIPKITDDYNIYLKIADAMLYDAKKQGRNRIIWTDEKMKTYVEKESLVKR